MIEALKDDTIINKLGGRFKLTALIQRRLVQLMHGSRPMVDDTGLTPMELVVREILEGKIKPKDVPQETDFDDEV
ncbi:MAG: DNA-directed RNA polymerase subunit omega [Phycisphaerae bacterium]|nr:DNA-directed RNA polymerase subunit omega [Phycisphaerae bacterium]